MNIETVLQNFGLTDAEVRVYLTLLRLGEATASTLAQKTNTNRTFTYDRLKKLLGSGFVSYVTRDNKKYFMTSDPNQLLSIIKEKEEQIKTILPELEKLKLPQKEGPVVSIFSSRKGVQTALNLILKDKKEVYIHGSMTRFKETMENFYEIWNKRRVKEKIPLKVLSNEEVQLELTEIDILSEHEKSSTTTFTFGNKSILVLWSEIPIAIFIESEEIAKDNTTFFNNIWNREIKIYSGVDGIVKAFFELVSKKTSIHLGIGYSWDLAQIYGTKISDEWHKLRLKKGVKSKLIAYDDTKTKEYFKVRMNKWKNFKIRFLDKDICGPACVTLSDHMIATVVYTEKDLKVIVNKNKETIAVYKKYFENIWERAKDR